MLKDHEIIKIEHHLKMVETSLNGKEIIGAIKEYLHQEITPEDLTELPPYFHRKLKKKIMYYSIRD